MNNTDPENNSEEPLDDLRDFLTEYVKKEEARPAPPPPLSPERRKLFVKIAQICALIAAAVYLWSAAPELNAAFSERKPLRHGTYDTDKDTDRCIKNLWALAAGMAEAASISCPVSGLQYLAEGPGFRCPSPERHALASLAYVQWRGVLAVRPGEEGKH